MDTFKLFVISVMTLMLTLTSVEGSDMCPAPIDGSSIFNAATKSYTNTVYLAKNAQHHYYFDIQMAGTLTIQIATANKISLTYSENSCPVGSDTGVKTKVVTTTGPLDFNLALYANNSETYTITATFVPTPLGITKTNTPSLMAINTPTPVTYTLSVRNDGTDTLDNVTVSDTFPAGLTIGAINASGWSCSPSGQNVTCTLGSLAAGAKASDINISTTATFASAQTVTNTARAEAEEWKASNSSNLSVVSGAGEVDLEIQKFASNNVIPPNTNFAYLIFVINYDNDDAQLVRVTDTLPPLTDGNISFISAGGNGWSCTTPTDANRTFVCDYNQPLGKGITYFTVNAKTGGNDFNNTFNVQNCASVDALNDISGAHSLNDCADINISTEGGGGASLYLGYYPQGGSIEVSDRPISNRVNAEIWTKMAATQNTTFPVYFVNPTTGAVVDYNGTNQDVPLTVVFKLTDETCSAANETYLGYDPTKSVIAKFNAASGSMVGAKTEPDTTFDLRNIAKRNSRLVMKYVDINALLDYSGESCSNSNLSANIKGLPQCIANSVGGNLDNNKYINVFGIAAFVRCAINNGQPCNASNGGVGDEPYNTEYGCYECTVGGSGYCSKDNFAIRPKQFDLNITSGAVLKAEAINLAFKGLTNNTVIENTLDYNETQNTTFAVDINISDSTKTCQEMNLSISPQVHFVDGLDLDNFRFSNIGDVNLTVHDINGSEFAIVDENDTTPTVSRFITPYSAQFRIIPHHFTIDGNITNGSNGFTYLSNFEEYNTTESRNISATLDLNVTAMRDDEVRMSNYTETCYSKNGNLTMNLANALSPTPVGALSKFLWYDANHADNDHNGSLPLNQTSYIFSLLADQYDNNDTNGTAMVNYLFNFDRNQTKVVDPIHMTVNNIEADDADAVHGEKNLNSTIHYLYGRLIPRNVRVFNPALAIASAWYEAYNAGTALTTPLPPSRNESMWFINTRHTDVAPWFDGDGNVTQWQTGGAPSVTKTPMVGGPSNQGVETYNFGTLPLGGYKMHINTDPWLWYGVNAQSYVDPVTGNTEVDCFTHPCFNVIVVPAIGATGSAKTESEDTKASKKSDQGTGWRSTSDYAPAVR